MKLYEPGLGDSQHLGVNHVISLAGTTADCVGFRTELRLWKN